MSIRIGALVSGAGAQLRALAAAIERGEPPGSVEVVVANTANSSGLGWAQAAGLRTALFDRQELPSRARRQEAARRVLEAAEVDLVVVADFDEPLTEGFVAAFQERLIGVVSTLLPAFFGEPNPVAAALAFGVKVTGCTAHFVASGPQPGPIILQRAIEVREVDTVESLTERLEAESLLALPAAVRLFAEGRLRLDGRRVHIV